MYFRMEFATSVWKKTNKNKLSLNFNFSFSPLSFSYIFPIAKEQQAKFAAAVFIPSCTHFSLQTVLCNMYILRA